MSAAISPSSQRSVDTPEPGVLYRSTGVAGLRVLAVFSLAFALGSGIFAWMLLRKDSPIGNAISSGERMVWAVALVVFFCGFFGAVWLYLRHVASCIRLLPDGKTLKVTTPTLFSERDTEIDVNDLIVSKYHDGDKHGEEASSPPWLWVQVRGRKSFFVSLSGSMPEKQRLLALLRATR